MKLYTVPVGRLATNCYILASESQNCLIIDPGSRPDKIIQVVRENALTPKGLLITHGHHDHIGAAKKVSDAFGGLSVSIGENDICMLNEVDRCMEDAGSNDVSEFIVADPIALHNDDVIELDELSVRVLETPGHTKGGVCFIVGNMIFSGDTLFRGDIGWCNPPNGDYPTMKRSLAKLCELIGDYDVYPGHGESTTLDHERRGNIYILEPMPVE